MGLPDKCPECGDDLTYVRNDDDTWTATCSCGWEETN